MSIFEDLAEKIKQAADAVLNSKPKTQKPEPTCFIDYGKENDLGELSYALEHIIGKHLKKLRDNGKIKVVNSVELDCAVKIALTNYLRAFLPYKYLMAVIDDAVRTAGLATDKVLEDSNDQPEDPEDSNDQPEDPEA